MYLRGVLSSILLVLIFCDPLFSLTRPRGNWLDYETGSAPADGNTPPVAVARHAIHAQGSNLAIEPLNPGAFVSGSIPAPAVANDCLLGDVQYKVEFQGGSRTLIIDLQASENVDLYVRSASPITGENGQILADLKSATPRIREQLIVPVVTPALERVTYFIAVTNCGTRAANYFVRALVLDAPDADVVGLSLNDAVVGSIPSPDPGSCRISRTQYTATASFAPCAGSFSWLVTVHSDQNVNVYVRRDKPVAVENGLVIYDQVTNSQAKEQTIRLLQSTPGHTLFYVAIENCGFEAANYAVFPGALVGDVFPPFITGASFKKKDLRVVGHFGSSAVLLLDGQPQQTSREINSPDVLIVKKAKKNIDRGQSVRITVEESGCPSPPFIFTRP